MRRHGTRAGDRVASEFLADAANGAAAFWKTDRWGSRNGVLIRSAALYTRSRLARRCHIGTVC
jgi:hypothetical protein